MPAFSPRPAQQAVLAYTGGQMGVSAVPGSGKTWTLSLLAANLLASGRLEDTQEVLIVTLVNSAVDNFSGRVRKFLSAQGLFPIGYRVRTLHGLCHDIVRERPALAGLSDQFDIMDEQLANELLREAANNWLRANPVALDDYLIHDLDARKAQWVQRQHLPDLVVNMATAFIRQAKDLQLTPPELRFRADRLSWPLPLVEMGLAIYTDYQRALAARGGVDFDDLIRLALHALRQDEAYLTRLRQRWPYILEDEAQDSSRLQQEILTLLTGPQGNWVRVGDPNQAIYETFTTANPRYLREFIHRKDVQARELPNSGRSMLSVIQIANALSDWTQAEHPVPELRQALTRPHIAPAPPGDPQPNPPNAPEQVKLVLRKFTPQEELDAVANSLERWLVEQSAKPPEERETAAVLTPRNQRGFEITEALKARKIAFIELLRSSRATREAAGALGNIVAYLADPASPPKLATAYRVWRREDRDADGERQRLEAVSKQLRKCRFVEDFLWPRADRNWLDALELEDTQPALHEHLAEFRAQVRRWQEAVALPIDQLVLTIAQDLFTAPSDLAVAHKLALVLRSAAAAHPEWRLPELTQELAVVAKNERKFLGLSDEDTGFEPDAHRGEIVVATMHKAKGLEWDRVYLMSVNTYDFPAAMPGDSYISERWFVRDRLNLEAEVLEQLRALRDNDLYDEGTATELARIEYAAERLRLLYVGITRARKALIVTWNTGRQGSARPAVAFDALEAWWGEQNQRVSE